jgi:hypothetical protein
MELEGKAEKVTGGCFCGAVRYEAEVYLHDAYYCHCRICQKVSGVPAEVGVIVKPGSLRLTRGEPKYYQTSHFAERGFCSDCGSRLFWRPVSPEAPDEWINLPVGTLDYPEKAVPASHMCVESQLPWYKIDDGLPRTRTEDDPELAALWLAQDQRSEH